MRISRSTFYELLFVLCVAAPYFNMYELTFIVWIVAVWATFHPSFPLQLWKQFLIFGGIAAIAFFSGLFQGHRLFDFIKDGTYLIKPILGLLIGYQLARTHLVNPLRTIIRAGVFIAVVHLIMVAFTVVFLHIHNIHELRGYAGFFSDFEIYALIILIFHKAFGLELSRKQRWRYLLILTVSSLFYLSRVNMIQFAILFVAMKGYFVWNRRAMVWLFSSITLVLLSYMAILYANPRRNGTGLEAFFYKVKIAPIEAFKTRINRDDWKDFNDNYRSLEAILVVQQNSSETANILFGKGLGSVVDLHREVELDGNKMEYIAIVHNGFMTVYLKSGIVGVILLVIGILALGRFRTGVYEDRYLDYLVTGTVVFLFFSYWVFLGLYFKADTKSIVIGALVALLQRRIAARKMGLVEAP